MGQLKRINRLVNYCLDDDGCGGGGDVVGFDDADAGGYISGCLKTVTPNKRTMWRRQMMNDDGCDLEMMILKMNCDDDDLD